MILYLIRHAHAVDAGENPERPLSAAGRNQVAQLVETFRRDGRLHPTEFWHSPLQRSLETARLLATGLDLTVPFVLTPGLEPEDDPAWLLPRLKRIDHDLAIVGHEPHLGILTDLLLGRPSGFIFHKGSVLVLSPQSSGWQPLWEARPKSESGI